jgi:hypothetical protein
MHILLYFCLFTLFGGPVTSVPGVPLFQLIAVLHLINQVINALQPVLRLMRPVKQFFPVKAQHSHLLFPAAAAAAAYKGFYFVIAASCISEDLSDSIRFSV